MDKPLMEEVFEKAGGRKRLQRSLKLSKQTMSDWVRNGEVSIPQCPMVHAITKIPLSRLNRAFAVKAPKASKAEKATA